MQINQRLFYYADPYSLNVDLIPRTNADGCPKNTLYKVLYGLGSCRCEDHCSWELCRLTVPPKQCIIDTYSVWQWDDKIRAWVAQVNQSKICYTVKTYNTPPCRM